MVTMLNHLAIDAGGTSTRAVFLTAAGQCLGYGVAGGGNPVSRGFLGALDALAEAAGKALGDGPSPFATVTVCMAGASLDLPEHLLGERFAPLGLAGHVMIEADLLGTFYSGTFHDDGYALIAGTGAVAGRIAGGQLAAVADGSGWLLGDKGSGFWLGREVVRAAAAALDGRGQPTALTALVLAEFGITLDPLQRSHGRSGAQQQLIAETYRLRPVELSRFAPLVFFVPGDAVAGAIIDRAADELARTLTAVLDARTPGPLVFGGSVLTKGGTVAAEVVARLSPGAAFDVPSGAGGIPHPVLVDDGVVGAAVLALKRSGVVVEATVFERISSTLAALRG